MMLSSRTAAINSRKARSSCLRHYVKHNYQDHSDITAAQAASVPKNRRRGGVAVHFPVRLHEALDQIAADGNGAIISWQPHGRCFVIHKPKEFEMEIMPK